MALGTLFVLGLMAGGVYFFGWGQSGESAVAANEPEREAAEPDEASGSQAPPAEGSASARGEETHEPEALDPSTVDSEALNAEEGDAEEDEVDLDQEVPDSMTTVSDETTDSMTPVSDEVTPAGTAPIEGRGEVEALIEAAQQATAERRYDEAEGLARRAIAAAPENGDAAYRLALVHLRRREYQEALEWASRAQALSPRDPLPIALEGDIAAASGQFRRAVRAYERALEVEPRFGPATRRLEGLRARGIEN